jgi:hypothetical protein
MLAVMIAAAALNYVLGWKFLSTTVVLGAVGLSLGNFVLLFIDRDFRLRTYEVTQEIPGLPESLDPDTAFKGIISYRNTTEQGSSEKKGLLVRREWQGPISDADRDYLLNLSEELTYRDNVNYLIDRTRKAVTPQVLKAALLLVAVLMILSAFAVAASTRLDTAWTLLATTLLLCAGLVSDHYLRPRALAGEWLSRAAYYAVPNLQFFWLIDAVAEDTVIPWAYLGQCFAYAAVFSAGLLALGAALFETREVG